MEAIRELSGTISQARIEGVTDPYETAQGFVRWMIREGWRPVGHRVERVDPNKPGVDAPPAPEYLAAKAALRGES